jgi:dethiobiotin synthetase
VTGVFVTATDTGVGKSILSASLLAALVAEGHPVRAYKPVVTGLHDAAEIAARGDWPADDELLADAAGMNIEEVTPLCFGPAVSPHLAAQLAGMSVDPAMLIERARAHDSSDTLVVEGVGGLLTPLTSDFSICDLAVALGLPVLIAARPGLGTINHTLLTLNVARHAGLHVQGVVLTPWHGSGTLLERSNRSTIARLGGVQVECLSWVNSPTHAALAHAGRPLVHALSIGQTPGHTDRLLESIAL